MKPFDVMRGVTASAPVVTVNIFNSSPNISVVDPSDGTAQYRLASSGAGTSTGNSGWTWLTAGNNTDVEVRATLNSGALTSGTTGSWQSLGSTRTWTVTRTTVGTSSANVTIEIRRVSDSVVIDTATITFSATVTASSPVVQLFAMSAGDFAPDPANSVSTVTFSNTGVCSMIGNLQSPGDYSWLISGNASDCEIFVTLTSGTFTSSSGTGLWLNLGTTRAWSITETVSGSTKTIDATVQIRNATTLAVLAGPVQFDFSAEVVP